MVFCVLLPTFFGGPVDGGNVLFFLSVFLLDGWLPFSYAALEPLDNISSSFNNEEPCHYVPPLTTFPTRLQVSL